MLLELRTISRKTPGDGRLEVTATTAQTLAAMGDRLPVLVGGTRGAAVMTEMACTCAKAKASAEATETAGTAGAAGAEDGDARAHVHHFLQSDLFRALIPDTRVRLDLDAEAGTVRLTEQR